MVRVTEQKLEPSEKGKGLFSYLLNQVESKIQQCDLLLQDVIPTQEHTQIVDITVPWVYTSASLLMHVPDESVNIYAVVKPFQWPIWVGLVISIVCVIFILYLLQRYFQENQLKTSSSLTRPRVKTLQTKAQGDAGPCPSNRLPFRIVAGAWSLAAFIFVQAYTSTLSTYVLTPINNPLVNSPYEIPEMKDVQLLGLHYHKDVILENFKKTGKCNLQLGKESLVNVMGSFALTKNSKYTTTVNRGLLEIIEAGLIDYWDVMLRPIPLQCLKNIGKDSNMLKLKSKKPPALTLKNLTGAFIILLLGFSLSLLAFLCEKIVSMPSRNRRRLMERAQMRLANKSANSFQEKV
ncbi:hypothetical protein DAPPUDRAFT_235850 [Daphnia pulex]|uniref:Ionotropic glutamate receptor C-terminal domain-containing protein n=1 Tax=Daphnia pulex TaxID=6669 RepID=E9FZ75_DAPPU|nr:hypothetical protein DAPPUDRAFT_235850 [Daphnia pulex]|eukprot:EFX87004.1 hypothetical protein DAPPUDRAFT_235850 [Daphnia pulex]